MDDRRRKLIHTLYLIIEDLVTGHDGFMYLYDELVDCKCEECAKRYHMPYRFCCLDVCGELEMCRECTKGVYLKGEGK